MEFHWSANDVLPRMLHVPRACQLSANSTIGHRFKHREVANSYILVKSRLFVKKVPKVVLDFFYVDIFNNLCVTFTRVISHE